MEDVTCARFDSADYLTSEEDIAAYLDAVIDTKLNWAFASENLARGTVWTYA